MALESRWILSPILAHKTRETLSEREYEGCFFLMNAKKKQPAGNDFPKQLYFTVITSFFIKAWGYNIIVE
jgi:hypothetical protein